MVTMYTTFENGDNTATSNADDMYQCVIATDGEVSVSILSFVIWVEVP